MSDQKQVFVAGRSKIRIPFRISIATLMASMVVITSLALLTTTYHTATETTLQVADRLMAAETDGLTQRTNHFLSSVEIAVRQFCGARTVVSDQQFIRMFISTLTNVPQITQIYIGDPHGGFLSLQKIDEGKRAYFLKQITVAEGCPKTELHSWLDRQGNCLGDPEKMEPPEYDPRCRPWYSQGEKLKQFSWTDLYTFASTGKPGITATLPFYLPDGTLHGIVGADVSLDSLSSFLTKVTPSENALAFIVNENLEIVAWPHPEEIFHQKVFSPVTVNQLPFGWTKPAVEAYRQAHGPTFFYYYEGKRILAQIGRTSKDNWYTVILAPEDDFVENIKSTHRVMGFICILLTLVAILMAIGIARGVSRAIEMLASEMEYVRDYKLDRSVVYPDSIIREISTMTNAFAAMKTGLQAFGKYLPLALVRKMICQNDHPCLGGQSQIVTILFSDIQDFTTISENTSPELLLELISEYHALVTDIIEHEQGIVDKYIGDGVMAVWNAPMPLLNHPMHACCAAVKIQQELEQLNAERIRKNLPAFITRIGIHTGDAIVGNVGTNQRMNYTVMGDAANVAARLESANKKLNSRILVSQQTRQSIDSTFQDGEFTDCGDIQLKGRAKAIHAFRLDPVPS